MSEVIVLRAVHSRKAAGFNVPLCGQTGASVITIDKPGEVTCKRCLSILAQQGQTEQSVQSPEQWAHAYTQEVALDYERRLTRHEVLSFIEEGDLDAAIFRMQRGFERQLRLAGLGGYLRQSREKETAV